MTSTAKRILLIVILISIPFIAWWFMGVVHQKTTLPQLPPEYQKIGIINMAFDHPIKMSNVLNGVDPLLVITRTSPYYEDIMQRAKALGNTSTDIRFEISLYDSNKDGLIDNEDPIWRFLYVIIFKDNGQNYDVKTLDEIGIRAILLKHITPKSNHTVILSDGSERVLFELGTPLKGLVPGEGPEEEVNPFGLSKTGS